MKNELEDFLRSHGGRLDQETPDPAVLHRILEHMQGKHSPKHRKRFVSFRILQWAAACLIFVVGGWLLWAEQKDPANQATVQESVSRLPPVESRAKDSLAIATVATKKVNEVKPTTGQGVKADLTGRKQAVTAKVKMHTVDPAEGTIYAGLKNGASPASRIRAVNSANTLKHQDNQVINALVETLNTDLSANVRLAVLDALAQSKQGSYVRKRLVASLQQQQDPVVQIALINLLTGMGESGILKELDRIVKDENSMTGVKDCAYASILRLRSS